MSFVERSTPSAQRSMHTFSVPLSMLKTLFSPPPPPTTTDTLRVYSGDVDVRFTLDTQRFDAMYGQLNSAAQEAQRAEWERQLNQHFFGEEYDQDDEPVLIVDVKKGSLELDVSLPIGCYARVAADMQRAPLCLLGLPLVRALPLVDEVRVLRLVAASVVADNKRDLWSISSQMALPSGIKVQAARVSLQEPQRRLLMPAQRAAEGRYAQLSVSSTDPPASAVASVSAGAALRDPVLGVDYTIQPAPWDPELDGVREVPCTDLEPEG